LSSFGLFAIPFFVPLIALIKFVAVFIGFYSDGNHSIYRSADALVSVDTMAGNAWVKFRA
jgi:hypothetical protein